MRYVFCAFVLIVAPIAAKADSCSAALAPEAKLIYNASSSGFGAASDKREFVKGKVMALVNAGSVSRFSAKSSAQAAAECLKQLH
jgi:hypothetical protein